MKQKEVIIILLLVLSLLIGCTNTTSSKDKSAKEFVELFFKQVDILQKSDNFVVGPSQLDDEKENEKVDILKKYYDDLNKYVNMETIEKYLGDQELLSTKYYDNNIVKCKIENFKSNLSDKREDALDTTFDVHFINNKDQEVAKETYKIRFLFDKDKMISAHGDMFPPKEL